MLTTYAFCQEEKAQKKTRHTERMPSFSSDFNGSSSAVAGNRASPPAGFTAPFSAHRSTPETSGILPARLVFSPTPSLTSATHDPDVTQHDGAGRTPKPDAVELTAVVGTKTVTKPSTRHALIGSHVLEGTTKISKV